MRNCSGDLPPVSCPVAHGPGAPWQLVASAQRLKSRTDCLQMSPGHSDPYSRFRKASPGLWCSPYSRTLATPGSLTRSPSRPVAIAPFTAQGSPQLCSSLHLAPRSPALASPWSDPCFQNFLEHITDQRQLLFHSRVLQTV